MIANVIANMSVSIIWWIYLYKNVLTSLLYFRYYDVDNKVMKIFILILYHFSDEMVSLLFLLEYIRMFLSMKIMKNVNIYKYIKYMEYSLLSHIVYPYYGKVMLNTGSKLIETMAIIFVLNLYKELNRIVYMRIYSKYKKSECCDTYVKKLYKKRVQLYYFCDYIKDEIEEYYKVKARLDRYCVYMLMGYTMSLISYNMWVCTFYLYYMSLIVSNYCILDNILFRNTRIKENEKYCQLCYNVRDGE
jgi:hypothetical protein